MAPASSDELDLHSRLLSGDETASADLFDRYTGLLVGALRKNHPRIADYNETLLLDAVTDALFDYIRRPEIYKPGLKSLKSFLYMAANGDLLNAWRRVKAAARSETSLDQRVELGQEIGNNTVDKVTGMPQALARIATAELWRHVQEIVPEAEFQQVLALMIDGVRETGAYAQVLGIIDLPEAAQRKRVKQVKDRLKKRLQRADWEQWQVISHDR